MVVSPRPRRAQDRLQLDMPASAAMCCEYAHLNMTFSLMPLVPATRRAQNWLALRLMSQGRHGVAGAAVVDHGHRNPFGESVINMLFKSVAQPSLPTPSDDRPPRWSWR